MSSRNTTLKIAVPTLALSAAAYGYLWLQKQAQYQQLRAKHQALIVQHGPSLQFDNPVTLPAFTERIVSMPDLLPAETFEALKAEITSRSTTERSYLPTHKQGGTVAYENLHRVSPKAVALFHAPEMLDLVSQVVGERVYPSPIHDQSACSLLYYTEPGDHIGWHYDHNFYAGRHFTVLLPIVNRQNDQPEQLSSAQLVAKVNDEERIMPTPPNTLIVFEGAEVVHKVTRLGPGETRILLSMTYVTTPEAPIWKAVARRFKDVAFFGVRALWT